MKLAVIGSRSLTIKSLSKYIPRGVTEIVSGGAKGVDEAAKEYASENKIKFVEFLPNYQKFGKGAPLLRNLEIIRYADEVLAFWDGQSRGTEFVIENAKRSGKKVVVVLLDESENAK